MLLCSKRASDERMQSMFPPAIPAASLSVSDNPEGQKKLLDFLNSDDAHAIWKKHGYVVLN